MPMESLFVELFTKLGYTRGQAQHVEELLEAYAIPGASADDVAALILKYGVAAIREMERLHGCRCPEEPTLLLFPTIVPFHDPRREGR